MEDLETLRQEALQDFKVEVPKEKQYSKFGENQKADWDKDQEKDIFLFSTREPKPWDNKRSGGRG